MNLCFAILLRLRVILAKMELGDLLVILRKIRKIQQRVRCLDLLPIVLLVLDATVVAIDRSNELASLLALLVFRVASKTLHISIDHQSHLLEVDVRRVSLSGFQQRVASHVQRLQVVRLLLQNQGAIADHHLPVGQSKVDTGSRQSNCHGVRGDFQNLGECRRRLIICLLGSFLGTESNVFGAVPSRRHQFLDVCFAVT